MPSYDIDRDSWLRRRSYRLLRFGNDDIVDGTDRVVAIIKAAVDGAPVDGRYQLP
jgi:very-short-patch-repair endonuclease